MIGREPLIEVLREAETLWRGDPNVRDQYREHGEGMHALMADSLSAHLYGSDEVLKETERLRAKVEELEDLLGHIGELADQISEATAADAVPA